MYYFPAIVNGEDGEGNVVLGSWRNDESSTSLTSVSMISSNRYCLVFN